MTTNNTSEFLTPVGRLVGGDIFKPNTKNYEGQPLTNKQGDSRVEYIIAVAFSKADPATEVLRGQIYGVAKAAFPGMVTDQSHPPDFAFKWVDGDSTMPNKKGRLYCEKEGYPGNWVLKFNTGFEPRLYSRPGLEGYPPKRTQIIDPNAVKLGDYVRVSGNCKGNGNQNNPGVYLNIGLIELHTRGVAISTGPSADDAFGTPGQLPAGALVAPTGAAGGIPGGAPPPGAPGAAQAAPPPAAPPAGVPGQAPPGLPQSAPAPSPGFGAPGSIAPAPAPPAAPPAAPPPPAAAPAMKPGCPYTYQQLIDGGWTEDQMRTQGHLA